MALCMVMNRIDPRNFMSSFGTEQGTRRRGPTKGLVNDPPAALKLRPL